MYQVEVKIVYVLCVQSVFASHKCSLISANALFIDFCWQMKSLSTFWLHKVRKANDTYINVPL